MRLVIGNKQDKMYSKELKWWGRDATPMLAGPSRPEDGDSMEQ